MGIKQRIANLSSLSWILIICILILILYLFENKFLIDKILLFNNISNYAVALGTTLLAFFTWRVATNTISASDKEIIMNRYKDILNILYTPLMGEIASYNKINMNPKSWLNYVSKKWHIQDNYELYGSDKLIELLRIYYGEVENTKYEENINAWDNLCENIITVVKEDFQKGKDYYISRKRQK